MVVIVEKSAVAMSIRIYWLIVDNGIFHNWHGTPTSWPHFTDSGKNNTKGSSNDGLAALCAHSSQ